MQCVLLVLHHKEYTYLLNVHPQYANAIVLAADIPVAPNITSCVVDNWETMLCTWEMPKQETGLPTNYTLGWTLL